MKLVTSVATVPAGLKWTPSVDRDSWKPVSLVLLSVHERLICVPEVGVAVKLLGAAGGLASTAPVATLSNVDVLSTPLCALVRARPTYTVAAMGIVTEPTAVKITPSCEA